MLSLLTTTNSPDRRELKLDSLNFGLLIAGLLIGKDPKTCTIQYHHVNDEDTRASVGSVMPRATQRVSDRVKMKS